MSNSGNKIFGQELVNQAVDYACLPHRSTFPQLDNLRTKALADLKNSGFPGPKSEEYKFTRLTKAVTKKFDLSLVSTIEALPKSFIEDIRAKHEGANVLFFVNGQFKQEYSVIVSSADIFRIQSLSEYAKDGDLTLLEKKTNDPFGKQNDIYANDSMVIEIEKNKVLYEPVICYYLSANKDKTNHSFVKNTYIAHENSQACFVHFHLGIGNESSYVNESESYIVKKNAQVSLYKIQEESPNTVYIGNTYVYQECASTFSSYVFTLDGDIIRNNLYIEVNGEGCESNLFGLYLTHGKTHMDNHTTVNHIQPNCNSNELYKGIMNDQSRAVFNGKIFVQQVAQKTNAFQTNGNILLSDEAVINTKPQLEIWADDVKCSHGCTTGQLDEEAIFYLQTRGIAKNKAKALILVAYVTEVIEKIKLDWLKVEVTDRVTARLDPNHFISS